MLRLADPDAAKLVDGPSAGGVSPQASPAAKPEPFTLRHHIFPLRGGQDYVHMHLREPTPAAEGERVHTRQRIGKVGETGNAGGCHLHFEIWSASGWYDGGRPFDTLKEWDDHS